MNSPSPSPAFSERSSDPTARSRVLFKMAAIGCLILLGLVPLTLIRGVLSERRARHREAIANITSTWGNPQVIAGPVLMVPYQRHVKAWKEQIVDGRSERHEVTETVVARAHFLPIDLSVTGDLRPDRLHRGIYEAVVYRSALEIKGRFAKPSFADWKMAREDILWDEAAVVIGITDLRGANEALRVKWGEETLTLAPGGKVGSLGPTIRARVPGMPFDAESIAFEFSLNLNGSGSLRFAPFGMSNRVRLTSPFPDPSFDGAFLPSERKVSASGFQADWLVSYYGRGYPQQWSDHEGDLLSGEVLSGSLFGVSVLPVVDSYRYVERSIKYGILFLALVFTAFFLFEVRALVPVHPFQYTLVGAALCLFYLALLSLSEIVPFTWAYAAGAGAATSLIGAYSAFVLRGARRAWLTALGLSVIYGYLFIILRQQEYSLLFGTVALFLALGAVMYATRKIDWYARDREG